MSKWIIIYPRGNRKKISIAEISPGMNYEIGDYALASRQHFYNKQEAKDYAVELAQDHGLQTDIEGVHDFLD